MTVEELDERISSAEFSQWIAYSNIEPFGYPMDNFRMGVPAAAFVNAIRSTVPVPKGRPRPKAIKASDFYPKQAKAEPDLTPEQRAYIERKKQQKNKPAAISAPRARVRP
ncbi:hypothetical protein [Steroidobacter sp.]|uniref:phage tail assembly protein T n=1 Tax=Steroidobacter sp. TaxID=1978227 RepID=UPI001A5075D9|nr:hypothetical protein [Steroidobacter sp.]MBL8268056.1 hypothetical protein [Steroidobacter sp.]